VARQANHDITLEVSDTTILPRWRDAESGVEVVTAWPVTTLEGSLHDETHRQAAGCPLGGIAAR
jgi:hypothetical protein